MNHLKEFIEFFATRFMQKLRDYELLFVEIFFPKHSQDCKYIDVGGDPAAKALAEPLEE